MTGCISSGPRYTYQRNTKADKQSTLAKKKTRIQYLS